MHVWSGCCSTELPHRPAAGGPPTGRGRGSVWSCARRTPSNFCCDDPEAPMRPIRAMTENLRRGRLQRTLAAATAVSAVALGVEIYLEHYKGSFGDRWMWAPLVATPPLVGAGVAGVFSERAGETLL